MEGISFSELSIMNEAESAGGSHDVMEELLCCFRGSTIRSALHSNYMLLGHDVE